MHARRRSASEAKRGRASRAAPNGKNWKCEMYRVEVYLAGSGDKILEIIEVNDLACLSFVRGKVSSCFMLPEARVELIYQGYALDPSCNRKSLFEIGAFKRHLEFDAVLVPPTRCNVCCYAHFRKKATPPGPFVPGSAMFDYKFVAGEQEGVAMEEPFFRELSLGEIRVLEESNGWGERAEAFDIDAECYCALKASDFGWKSMRFWTRLIGGLLERVK